MPDLRLEQINQTDRRLMSSLMDAEEQAWRSELDWDYTPIRHILNSFIGRRALPGYVALRGESAVGYTYFLIQKDRALVGAVYATAPDAQLIADALLSLELTGLKDTRNIRRIEAQPMPLSGVDFSGVFTSHGFQRYLRDYRELDLTTFAAQTRDVSAVQIVPWDSGYISLAAELAFRSYRNEVDAVISEDYCSITGCEGYLRSLVEQPGCGIFLPNASFISLDLNGAPCGFIISSRISGRSAMIPQISIAPSHQGIGLGTQLIVRALQSMRQAGFRAVRLTVTHKNRRAYEWYTRLGFNLRRNFGAYLWLR
jgi:ribosomal protein S18 acetylase RimI-like enzyme